MLTMIIVPSSSESMMLARASMGEEVEVKDLVAFAEQIGDLDLLGDIAEWLMDLGVFDDSAADILLRWESAKSFSPTRIGESEMFMYDLR